MHITRNNASKLWPIPRKGNKYVVVPSHNREDGIPLLIVMRDVIGMVRTRKELKRILNEGKIEINDRKVIDEKTSLLLFDVLKFNDVNKHYRLILNENKKYGLEEISDKEAHHKINKVTNKKVLKGNKLQINLNNGLNLISSVAVKVGDSVLVNFKEKKIEKTLPVKENSKILVIKGKHMGKRGEISKIEEHEIVVNSNGSELKIKGEELIVLG